MSGTYIEDLGNIYDANVLEESETVGKQDALKQDTSALKHSGPEAAEGFEPPKADSKIEDEGHVKGMSNPQTKKKEKTVKKESRRINTSTMKDKRTNKSTFDRLFEDVMGGDMDVELEPEGGGLDDLGGEDEFGDEGGEEVTLTLTADQADVLRDVLGQLDVGEEEEVEDIEDIDDLGGDEFENIESHAELSAAPDSVNSLTGMNNKAGNLNPTGGSAQSNASGQVDGGQPKSAADGKGKLQGKGNKVSDLRGNAFSK